MVSTTGMSSFKGASPEGTTLPLEIVTIQLIRVKAPWIPAFAGMTDSETDGKSSHSREGGNPASEYGSTQDVLNSYFNFNILFRILITAQQIRTVETDEN